MEYSRLVRSHFFAPKNVGRLAPAPDVIEARSGSKAQGIEVILSARVADERIVALQHLIYGCPHSIAAASWLTERLLGASAAELAAWSWRDAADTLEVPTEKWGRLLVLEDVVRALAKVWRDRSSNHAQTA